MSTEQSASQKFFQRQQEMAKLGLILAKQDALWRLREKTESLNGIDHAVKKDFIQAWIKRFRLIL